LVLRFWGITRIFSFLFDFLRTLFLLREKVLIEWSFLHVFTINVLNCGLNDSKIKLFLFGQFFQLLEGILLVCQELTVFFFEFSSDRGIGLRFIKNLFLKGEVVIEHIPSFYERMIFGEKLFDPLFAHWFWII